MALKECRECDGQVAENALRCPHCGAGSPGMSKDDQTFFIVMVVVGAFAIGALLIMISNS